MIRINMSFSLYVTMSSLTTINISSSSLRSSAMAKSVVSRLSSSQPVAVSLPSSGGAAPERARDAATADWDHNRRSWGACNVSCRPRPAGIERDTVCGRGSTVAAAGCRPASCSRCRAVGGPDRGRAPSSGDSGCGSGTLPSATGTASERAATTACCVSTSSDAATCSSAACVWVRAANWAEGSDGRCSPESSGR